MFSFKKSQIAAALTVAGCAMMAGQANAVYLNQDGLGQVLLYPYYTVRGDNVTLLSVVNTTANAKVVKVRFREGKNSADVLDFNLFLSKYDVWTAGVLPAADNGDGTGGSMLVTKDTSCVTPTMDDKGNTFASGIPFRTFDIGSYPEGQNEDTDTGATGVDRLKEGYVELIEMATIPNGSPLGKDVTHGAGSATAARKPACAAMGTLSSALDADARTWGQTSSNTTDNFTAASGGLFGAVTFVNAPIGGATTEAATALGSFWGSVQPNGFYYEPSRSSPNLGSGQPRSVLVSGVIGSDVNITDWFRADGNDGYRAVSAVLMRDAVYNEHAYTDDKVFSTDWVVTMPNKRPLVNQGLYQLIPGVGQFFYYDPLAPFQRAYVQGSGSCDDVTIGSYDREEGTSGGSGGSFSPVRPGARANALCWEANVISFGKASSGSEPSRVFGSTNNLWYAGFQNNGQAVASVGAAPQGEGGWSRISFAHSPTTTFNNHQLVGSAVDGDTNTLVTTVGGVSNPASITYNGLPVIGFAATMANQGARASYGTSVSHRYARVVTASGG